MPNPHGYGFCLDLYENRAIIDVISQVRSRLCDSVTQYPVCIQKWEFGQRHAHTEYSL